MSKRIAVITGTGGLGLHVALALAKLNFKLVLIGRNALKGEQALGDICAAVPEAEIDFELMDLASLSSIASCCQRMKDKYVRVDVLVNNAGIMAPPFEQKTEDGFELQVGVNYLGHFALTHGLLPLLRQSESPRVVSVTSLAYKQSAMNIEAFKQDWSYHPFKAYSESKLAMLVFAMELQRKSDANGWNLLSSAAHPGFAATDLFSNQSGSFSRRLLNMISHYIVQPIAGQGAAEGALPMIYAATSESVHGGELFGPDGPFQMKGQPKVAQFDDRYKDPAFAEDLWGLSETLTGLKF